MANVSVIIPARNAAATLGETIAGLAEQDYAGHWEAIVVDDGSTDETVAIARAAPFELRVIAGDGRGPAKARNAGARDARGQLLAFLDSDCRPLPGWLTAGTGALASADFVQGRTVPPPGDTVGPFDRTLWVTRAHGLYESANLFVRRELFELLGGFESWLGPARGKELAEDVWFGWRARRAGARVAFCEEAEAYHAVFQRGPAGYVAERSRLRFFPAMARRVPELREDFFYRRWFLTPRSAAFDLALVGLLAASIRRSPLPLVALLPYARIAAARADGSPRHAAKVLAVDAVADAVGLGSLLTGSITAGTPVL